MQSLRENLVTQASYALGVEGVSGFVSGDASLYAHAEKGEIAYHVQQLVPRRFVEVVQRREVTEFLGVEVLLTHLVAEIIHAFLTHLGLVDDECVLEVAAFDEPDPQQRFYLPDEAERTGGSYLPGVLLEVSQSGVLLPQEVGVEGDGHIHLVVVAGLDTHPVSVLGDILDRFFDDVYLLLRVLFLYPYALDRLHEQFRRTVKDRHLRCIDIDDTVIHAHGVERTQRMLHGAYFPFTVLQYRTAFGGGDIVRQRPVAGLFWQIHAPQAHTRIRRRRVEGSGHVQTRMQAYRTQRKTLFYGMLLQNQ